MISCGQKHVSKRYEVARRPAKDPLAKQNGLHALHAYTHAYKFVQIMPGKDKISKKNFAFDF